MDLKTLIQISVISITASIIFVIGVCLLPVLICLLIFIFLIAIVFALSTLFTTRILAPYNTYNKCYPIYEKLKNKKIYCDMKYEGTNFCYYYLHIYINTNNQIKISSWNNGTYKTFLYKRINRELTNTDKKWDNVEHMLDYVHKEYILLNTLNVNAKRAKARSTFNTMATIY